MESIQYIGELTWPGVLGRLAIIISFVSALGGTYAFLRSPRQPTRWQRIGRIYFGVHAAAVLSIIGLLLGLMVMHRYEYQYAWNHVSDALPMRYIFSAFWEGQEGSFLLWMFWHVILGGIVLLRNDKWADLVLGILLAIQCVIVSMLLGVYLTDVARIGSNPFLLLRDTMDAPLFNNPRYAELLEGNGLNPLLQNYWMTIHPPTLFLGFASVTIPFCYALAGLIRKDFTGWLKPVMPWALFSGGILGLGILMGGAWAYEALSFGGYWAWDPVENMSLVPWLVLVAAIHGNLVSRKTGHSLRLTHTLYLLAFLLVLYSTFLTRSGVLGDSSAHAFTQMGLEWQLVVFIGLFTLVSLTLLAQNWRKIPAPGKEEAISSREFWMFIGTLVLLFSAVLITFTTSIPVYNKLFDLFGHLLGQDFSNLHRTAPINPEAHYNKFQLWIAVFIGFLSGGAQFLRYREASWGSYRRKFLKHLGISAGVAIVTGLLLLQWIDANAWQYVVLVFAASFAITANLEYIVVFLRGHLKDAASALAHLGFGVMLTGILASGLNKHIISTNTFAQEGLVEGMDTRSHIYLIKNRPMFMNGYWVEYQSDHVEGNNRNFLVTYKRVDDNQDTVERFSLRPNVVFNQKNTKLEATNPSTKRYLTKDIFTYVAALPVEQMDVEAARALNDSLEYIGHSLFVGDTLRTEEYEIVLLGTSIYPSDPGYQAQAGDLGIQARIRVHDLTQDQSQDLSPLIYLRENLVYGVPVQVNDLNMRIRVAQHALTDFYPRDDRLPYQMVRLHQGDTATVGSWHVTLRNIDRNPEHPHYRPNENDVAVNAVLEFRNTDTSLIAKPLYYIRGNIPGNLKAYYPDLGLHVRFDRIDPQNEAFEFSIATLDPVPLSLEIARDVPRTDIIVLQAIVFPGINLFWLGACIMLSGLFLAMWEKFRKKSKAQSDVTI